MYIRRSTLLDSWAKFRVDWTHGTYVANFLKPVGYKTSHIRFVPAMSYGAHSDGIDLHNKTSILGMVRDGNAEMSDYVLSLTPCRDRDFTHTGPIFRFPSVFMYRRPKLGYAELNIFSVIPWKLSSGFIIFRILLLTLPMWFPQMKRVSQRSMGIFGLSLAIFWAIYPAKSCSFSMRRYRKLSCSQTFIS